jgi:hypothetical protein
MHGEQSLDFWRSWHRSNNEVIHVLPLLTPTGSDAQALGCRYIYIPLCGSKRVILDSAVMFSFVGMWHDLYFHVLAWRLTRRALYSARIGVEMAFGRDQGMCRVCDLWDTF